MPEPLISNVSDTARWMAAYRAAESARRDALFNDPSTDSDCRRPRKTAQ